MMLNVIMNSTRKTTSRQWQDSAHIQSPTSLFWSRVDSIMFRVFAPRCCIVIASVLTIASPPISSSLLVEDDERLTIPRVKGPYRAGTRCLLVSRSKRHKWLMVEVTQSPVPLHLYRDENYPTSDVIRSLQSWSSTTHEEANPSYSHIGQDIGDLSRTSLSVWWHW